MPEKEPQLGRKERAREKVLVSGMKYETWEETAQKLREKGVEKENIDAAFAVMQVISFFDRKIFPDRPAAFSFTHEESKYGHCAGFLWPKEGEEDDGERCYNIWTKDFAKFLNEGIGKSVPIFGVGRQLKWEKPKWPKLLVAAHEVRHRVQRDGKIKQFSPEDAKLVEDPLLRDIIEFCKILFEEREKIYRRERKSEEFITKKLNSKEFDSTVIEKFIANIINKKLQKSTNQLDPKDLDEIIAVIQMTAPVGSKQ